MVLVDLDDVLWDLLTPWVSEINRIYKTEVDPQQITDWNMSLFFPKLSRNQIYSPLFQGDFWKKVQPNLDSAWFINELLHNHHGVKVVTASHYKNLEAKMERFLKLFPMLSWYDVVITSDKHSIVGDVLIDDAPHNLEQGEYHGLLMHRPHNANYDADANGLIRVRNLQEAYKEIETLWPVT